MSSSFPSRRTPATPSGEPNVATLLTWFLPGAGHLYIGRTTFGLLAFVVIEGLYLLGLKLSGGMGFEFLQPELRGPFAPALAPELGNVGALIYHMKSYGYGLPIPRAFPDTVVLGTTLTAVSGVLNLCLMAHANFEARLPKDVHSGRRSPALPMLLTWVCPGLGHLFQGRKLRGLLVLASLVGCVVLGTLLADASNLSRERHYYYWGGQVMAGAPALLLQLLWGAKSINAHVPYAEAGLVFAAVAGMLNILAMLDVYGFAVRRWDAPEGEAETANANETDAPAAAGAATGPSVEREVPA